MKGAAKAGTSLLKTRPSKTQGVPPTVLRLSDLLPREFRGILFGALGGVLLLAAGCQQQMAKQPKYLPLEPSAFFEDGRSARPLVPGTVARGHLETDAQLFEGKREPSGEGAGVTTTASDADSEAPVGFSKAL